jgi:hypothetical protein
MWMQCHGTVEIVMMYHCYDMNRGMLLVYTRANLVDISFKAERGRACKLLINDVGFVIFERQLKSEVKIAKFLR